MQAGIGSATRPEKDRETLHDKITHAIRNGDRENIVSLLKNVLSEGEPAQDLVDKIMIPAIVHVGDLYEKRFIFTSTHGRRRNYEKRSWFSRTVS